MQVIADVCRVVVEWVRQLCQGRMVGLNSERMCRWCDNRTNSDIHPEKHESTIIVGVEQIIDGK